MSKKNTNPNQVSPELPARWKSNSNGSVNISKSENMFAHLPPDHPPSIGLVSLLPSAVQPYAEFMRIHKPAGYYAFLFPHLFGTLLAALSLSTEPPTKKALLRIVALEIVSNLFLRGAACSHNDVLDAPFDRLVKRCRHRPVARGAVSPLKAHLFALIQTGIWIATLTLMPRESWHPAMLLAGVMLLYPFCKRWTNFPQIVLGFSFALGQGIGVGCMKLDPWYSAKDSRVIAGLLAMYFGNVVNIMIYDTIYAYQDIEDDLKAGVMSMAIACSGWSKQWLAILSLVECTLLSLAGWSIGGGFLYWSISVGGTAMVLTWMLLEWNVDEPQSCWKWFQYTIWFTGATICSGLFGEYVYRM